MTQLSRHYRALIALALAFALLVPATAALAEDATETKPAHPILVVGGDVKAPVKLHSPAPYYSDDAREQRIQGVVIMQTVINEFGNVVDAKVLKGLHAELDQIALDTVSQWVFEPATLDGQPVNVYYNLTINFRLKDAEKEER